MGFPPTPKVSSLEVVVLFLLILYLAASLLLVALSLPLILGRVPPNLWYGFRIRRTLEDPDAWYRVNRHSGWRLLATGAAFGLAAAGLYGVPGLSVDTYALLCLAVFVLVFGAGLVQSILYLRRLPPRASPPPEDL